GDVPLLIQQYLRRFNRELRRDVHEIAPEAMERLRSYSWPGNIRELQSVLKQALLRATGSVLIPAFLPDALAAGIAAAPAQAGLPFESFIRQLLANGCADVYAEAHRELDRILLPLALESSGGSQRLASKLLGIARQTFRIKLRDAGLENERP